MDIILSPITMDKLDRVKFIINSVLPVTFPASFFKDLSTGKYTGLVAEKRGMQ